MKKLQEEIYQQLLILRESLASTIEEVIQTQPSAPDAQSTAVVASSGEDEELKKLREANVRL